MPPSHQRRRAPIWLMGLSNATIGLVGGFIVLPLPQLLAAEGIPEWKIATVSAACLSPGFWVLLVCPILDVRFSRRWYATFFAALAGLCLTFAVLMRSHLLVLEIAVMIAYAASVLSSNALGGWLAGVVPEAAAVDGDTTNHEGATLSAWTQVGLFLGNGLMAAIAAEGIRRLPLTLIAILLGALVILPAAIFPFIPVPITGGLAGAAEPARLNARESFGSLFRDLWALLKRREVLLTLLLFIAPTGSFALTNQLSGVAHDFHATDAFVGRMGALCSRSQEPSAPCCSPSLPAGSAPSALPAHCIVGSFFTLALLNSSPDRPPPSRSPSSAKTTCKPSASPPPSPSASRPSAATPPRRHAVQPANLSDRPAHPLYGRPRRSQLHHPRPLRHVRRRRRLSILACAAMAFLLWRLTPQQTPASAAS